jgi:ribosome-associated protein
MHEDILISVPDGPTFVIPGDVLVFSASTASGPGGQNVNKVSTKVELRFDLEASPVFNEAQKARIREALKNRMSLGGEIIITSQKSRVRLRNADDARAKLGELIAAALFVHKARRATKPSKGQKARRLDAKKKDSQKKQGRAAVRHHDD